MISEEQIQLKSPLSKPGLGCHGQNPAQVASYKTALEGFGQSLTRAVGKFDQGKAGEESKMAGTATQPPAAVWMALLPSPPCGTTSSDPLPATGNCTRFAGKATFNGRPAAVSEELSNTGRISFSTWARPGSSHGSGKALLVWPTGPGPAFPPGLLGELKARVHADGVAQLLPQDALLAVVGQLQEVEAGGGGGQAPPRLLLPDGKEAPQNAAQGVPRVLRGAEGGTLAAKDAEPQSHKQSAAWQASQAPLPFLPR